MRKMAMTLVLATMALAIHPADAGWRDRGGDRGRHWGEDRRCDQVRQVCRLRQGFGQDYRRCVQRRGCWPRGF